MDMFRIWREKTHFIFPITKGSVNASMKLVGFITSNMVKTNCFILTDAALLITWASLKVNYATL